MKLYNSRMNARQLRKGGNNRDSLCVVTADNSSSFALILSALGDELDTPGLRWVLRGELELMYFGGKTDVRMRLIDTLLHDGIGRYFLLKAADADMLERLHQQVCDISLVLTSCMLEVGISEERCAAVAGRYGEAVATELLAWSVILHESPATRAVACRYEETARWALRASTVSAANH